MQKVKDELASRPRQLTDTSVWLFVAVNTARALIDSTRKADLSKAVFEDCRSTGEIQLNFDMIQGIYGRSFNSKRDPAYNYLCSLVAFFPDKPLDDNEQRLIAEYSSIDEYLVYELQQ
ncbi:MAG: hypothetical protein II714_02290 [Oscillospiraceae bacterium]|nr:hypothetical protein [Oscillospiraceae bacterium]